MKSLTLIINLYHLLISEDGHVSDKEIEIAAKIAHIEGIEMQDFNDHMNILKSRDRSNIYKETIEELKHKSKQMQIRCIAWLCVIANADGFMDNKEWKFIYTLYNKDLKLDMNAIMQEQKHLKQILN